MLQNLFSRRLVPLIAIAVLPSSASFARLPGFLERFQFGYSFVIANAEYTSKLSQLNFFDPFNPITTDTTLKGTLNTKATFGITAGTFIPITQLGQKSSLNLSVDFVYNAMTWGATKDPNGFGSLTGLDYSGTTVQMGLPVGVDVKLGSDAVTDKAVRFCSTFGLGVQPSYNVTTLDMNVNIDPIFNVNPYVKAEVGMFTGFCWKLRAMYTLLDQKYLTYKQRGIPDPNLPLITESNASLTAKRHLTVSLIIMPFSLAWKRSEWWNTF